MRALSEHTVVFRNLSGILVAHVTLTPVRDSADSNSPLIEIDAADARENGETTIQLRESERYEYEVVSINGNDLRLRCSLASRRKSLKRGMADAGLIETRTFCGTLLMELVEGEVTDAKTAAASALIDVRSVKLDYRSDYRGMLRRLADEITGLIADARSSSKAGFRSTFEERTDEGWLQIQLELLRETLDSADFSASLQRILVNPHEKLATATESITTDHPIIWLPSTIRQLATGNPRRAVPAGHSLRLKYGIDSIPERVTVPRKSRNLDTPENRFVKYALGEFRSFLAHAEEVFESSKGWGASAAMARRLSAVIDDWLSRGFFREIGEMRLPPLGSPVLQRKAGYRELLRWWLRFRTAAELSWEGGEELFHAGQRDVATLYEYWLFFELLSWFCRKCREGIRPGVEELIDGLDESSPNLRLKKKFELGPFVGVYAGQSRNLNARFSYNRQFSVTKERRMGGSWTRRLHPDYTLTFWPEGMTETEAEEHELLVHVHFDAKYRLESIEGLFGAEEADDVDEESDGNYKRQDLLKMHAYRDAIKRSQGAYVLYPGRNVAAAKFKCFFHEVLPGLGAFGIAPDENGAAQGFKPLEEFLSEVLNHLCNRTTAQERISYHIAESYALREKPVPYNGLSLPEVDIYGAGYQALPPAEEMVLVAWYENEPQLALAQDALGYIYIRLGRRRGSFHVHPNVAGIRHVLMHTHGPSIAEGLCILREAGFRVFTRSQLRAELKAHSKGSGIAAWEATAGKDDEEYIYALFKTKNDPAYNEQSWDPAQVMARLVEFEQDLRNQPIDNLGRESAYPRILSLRGLLKARIAS